MGRKYIKRYRVDTRLGSHGLWRRSAYYITLKNAQASAEFWGTQFGAVYKEPFQARIFDRNTNTFIATMSSKVLSETEA